MEYGLVALWLVTYLALLLVGMPMARALLPRFEDRGAGLALPLSLAVLWLVAYFVGLFSIQVGLWLGVATLAVLSVLLQYRGFSWDAWTYAETAVVFTIAFLFVIGIRAFDPAASPGGGEKFLDMGLLQSLLRSSTIPPEDMWFAGETVRYYYGGHYLSSLLARITSTEARFAYNPALAGFYAMLVTGVYSLAGSIAAHRGFSRRWAGVTGAFFVGFASNLHTPIQFVLGRLPDSIASPLVSAFGIEIGGVGESVSEFSYWPSSRIIEGTINEFPLFAWLNGDLHAHMMSTMVLVLVVGVLADLWMGEDHSRRRRLAVLFGVVPPLAAMIAVFNTWSFPAVGGLAMLTVLLGPTSPAALLSPRLDAGVRARGPTVRELARIGIATVIGALVLGLGYLWSLQYWLFTASSQSSVGAFPSRSALGPLLIVHGVFIVLFWLHTYRHAAGLFVRRGEGLSVEIRDRRLAVRIPEPLLIVGASALVLAASVVVDAPAVGLFAPLVLLGWLLARWWAPADGLFGADATTRTTNAAPTSDGGRSGPRPGFEIVLIVAMAGLVIMTEFFHVAEPLAPDRFNTVFKVYAQVWVLAAIAAGVVAVRLISAHSPELGLAGPKWRSAFSVLVALLVVSTALYGALALTDYVQADHHRDADDLTLDALAFVEEDHPDEAPAIEWLLNEVDGQPNMASYPNDLGYTWANAPSSLTGVPTLVGWWPVRGYHGPDRYTQRKVDTTTIFTGEPEMQRYLLDYYDVELIYIGPHEREQFGSITVDDLDAVEPEKQWNQVTIYRVDQSALDAVDDQ